MKFMIDLTGRLVDIAHMSSRSIIRRRGGAPKYNSRQLTEEYNSLLDRLKSVTAALDTSKDMLYSTTLKDCQELVGFWNVQLVTMSLAKEHISKLSRIAIRGKHANLELVYANLAQNQLDKEREQIGRPLSNVLTTGEELAISPSPTLGSLYDTNEASPRTPIVKRESVTSPPVSTTFGGRRVLASHGRLGRSIASELFPSPLDPRMEQCGSTDTTQTNTM